MELGMAGRRDRSYGTDRQPFGRTYPNSQAASGYHRGDDHCRIDGGVRVFRRHDRLVKSPLSQPAGLLRADGGAVCLDQSLVSRGGSVQFARHLLPVLEVH